MSQTVQFSRHLLGGAHIHWKALPLTVVIHVVSACGNCSTMSALILVLNSCANAGTNLVRHDSGLPATLDRLLDARAQRRGVDVATTGLVNRASRFANDELVDVYARVLDFEHGRTARGVEERIAVLIARAGRLCTTVVSPVLRCRCR